MNVKNMGIVLLLTGLFAGPKTVDLSPASDTPPAAFREKTR